MITTYRSINISSDLIMAHWIAIAFLRYNDGIKAVKGLFFYTIKYYYKCKENKLGILNSYINESKPLSIIQNP